MKQSKTDVYEQSGGACVREDEGEDVMQQHGKDERLEPEKKLGIWSSDSSKESQQFKWMFSCVVLARFLEE